MHNYLQESALRVGVVGSVPHLTAGGGATLMESLLQALEIVKTRHTFIRPHEAGYDDRIPKPAAAAYVSLKHLRTMIRGTWIGDSLAPGIRLVRPPRDKIPWSAQMDQWSRMERINLLWFLAPPCAAVSLPYITTVWDLQHRSQPYFPEVSVTGWGWDARERAYRAVLPRASIILTGTDAGKREIVHYYRVNPENVAVVPFPIPFIAGEERSYGNFNIRQKYGIRGNFLLYPAQFWPHKNHINILIAMAILKERGLKLEVVFTGSDKGNAGYVSEKVKDLGLQDQIHILGFVTREDLWALYSNALALTFGTFFGPDNIPPLEAFALGCPVIASRVSGAQEQLGDAAMLFDPADPEELASAVMAISTNQQLRNQMIQKGTEIAKVRTPQAYVERVCQLLDRFARIRRCWGHDYEHT